MNAVGKQHAAGAPRTADQPPGILGTVIAASRATARRLTLRFSRSTVTAHRDAESVVPAPRSQADLFVDRLNALSERGRTLSFLLQSCILQIDSLLRPIDRVPPIEAPRSLPAAALRARRRHHYHSGLMRSHRGVPLGLALTMVAPALLIGTVFGATKVYESYVNEIVPPQQLAINQASRGARIYDRNGELLYEFVDHRDGMRFPVTLDKVAPAFLAATIATEDDTFFTNPGINPQGLARAAWENLSPFLPLEQGAALEGSGGSSITQQLIKNVYIPQDERTDRTVTRKLREAAYALELTRRYTKQQILEWYVNQISYGGLYNGVEAASQGYFGKPASDLTLAEATLLAGIPQTPANYDPLSRPESALERRNEILDLIQRRGSIQIGEDTFFAPALEEIEAARQAPIAVQPRIYAIEAPHFVLNHVAPQIEAMYGRDALYRDGLVVVTSLDMSLQRQAQENLERWISEFEAISSSHNGSVVVMDTHTGELLAVIGSRDYFREDIQGNVDNLTALNSPGSSFKPFVYLAAFTRLGWTPNTLVEDSPVSYREANGTIFQPTNPIKDSYLGEVSVAKALGNSLNVPAFKTALRLGVPAIVETARAAGFTTLHGSYGPAIAIGGVDLSAMDLTYGYSVLANNGLMVGQKPFIPHAAGERRIDPISVLRIEDSEGSVKYDVNENRATRQVIAPDKAYQVTAILSDPANQCITFGCGGVSIPGRTAAVKTGTSEPFDPRGENAGKVGETWAFGYTPDYVVGVWAGNSDNSPIVNIYSTSISFRVMRDTLQAAHRGQPSGAFTRPSVSAPDRSANTARPSPTARPSATRTPAAVPGSSQVVVTGASERAGRLLVQGSASTARFQSYRVELAPVGGRWSVIRRGDSPVQRGTLADISTAGLKPGDYNVRLVVQDANLGTIISPLQSVQIGPN